MQIGHMKSSDLDSDIVGKNMQLIIKLFQSIHPWFTRMSCVKAKRMVIQDANYRFSLELTSCRNIVATLGSFLFSIPYLYEKMNMRPQSILFVLYKLTTQISYLSSYLSPPQRPQLSTTTWLRLASCAVFVDTYLDVSQQNTCVSIYPNICVSINWNSLKTVVILTRQMLPNLLPYLARKGQKRGIWKCCTWSMRVCSFLFN